MKLVRLLLISWAFFTFADSGDLIRSYSFGDSQGVPFDKKLAFIEVGAHDGIDQSNTKLFEESYGWTGILVEPSPILFSRLCENRPNSQCFQCALGSFEEDGTYAFGDFDGSKMSSLDGKRLNRVADLKVLVRSLQSILDDLKIDYINLFSLDTEGHELNILKGIDFSRVKFDYILIEIYANQYDEIVSFLSVKGYEMIECFSNYSLSTNPGWDGSHNDYLFKRKNYESIN